MRKTIFAFMFAIMFSMALGSCNCGGAGNTTDVDSLTVDSTVVDSTVIGSIAVVDSLAADTVALDSIVVAE